MTEYVVAPKEEQIILRVSNSTDVHKLATSIKKNDAESRRVVISCIGVQTINQAMKSVAIANGQVASSGYVFFTLPYFHVEQQENGVEQTIMRFAVVKHLIGSV